MGLEEEEELPGGGVDGGGNGFHDGEGARGQDGREREARSKQSRISGHSPCLTFIASKPSIIEMECEQVPPRGPTGPTPRFFEIIFREAIARGGNKLLWAQDAPNKTCRVAEILHNECLVSRDDLWGGS